MKNTPEFKPSKLALHVATMMDEGMHSMSEVVLNTETDSARRIKSVLGKFRKEGRKIFHAGNETFIFTKEHSNFMREAELSTSQE